MKMTVRFVSVCAFCYTIMASVLAAQLVDFVETFEQGNANFADIADQPAQVIADGGVGDSAFIRTFNDFENATMGLVVTRAESGASNPLGDASGGAFVGDYLDCEVQSVSLQLRHDFDQPLDFSLRFAPALGNFPGAFSLPVTIAPSAEFQEIIVDFKAADQFGFEVDLDFQSFFGAVTVGNIQVFTEDPGVSGGTFNVDIDDFSIDVLKFLLGDVNSDGVVDLFDVSPFVDALVTGQFLSQADINQDGSVDLFDVSPFVSLLVD